jgi:hypothetical protein
LAEAQRPEASSFPPAAIRDSCGAPLVPINNQSGALGISVQQQQQHDELEENMDKNGNRHFSSFTALGQLMGVSFPPSAIDRN